MQCSWRADSDRADKGPRRLGGQHQGTANQRRYQRLRLMHKTSIRVVDGNELET